MVCNRSQKCLQRWGRQQQHASVCRWAKWFLNRWFLTSAQTCLHGKLSFNVVLAHRVFSQVKKRNLKFSTETWKLKKKKKTKLSFYTKAFMLVENLAQKGWIQMTICGNEPKRHLKMKAIRVELILWGGSHRDQNVLWHQTCVPRFPR